MKILICCDLYPPEGFGGVQTAVSNLAKSLAKRGNDVVVIAGGKQEKIEKDGRVVIHRIKNLSFPLYRHAPVVAYFGTKVKRLFEEEKFDVVHIELASALGLATLYEAKKRNIPTLFTLHALPENANQLLPFWPFNRAFESVFWRWFKIFIEKVDCVTCPSTYGLQLMTRQFRVKRAEKISNGLDLRRFKREYNQNQALKKLNLEDRKIILDVGRLNHEKSPQVLLDSVRGVVEENPDSLFVFIGGGPLKNSLTNKAKKSALEKWVKIPGFVPDEEMRLYYQGASVFVMPSTQELQGLSVMEAMAYSLPVIVADAKALPELVEIGKNGYTFKAYDKIDLASKINQVLSSKDLERLGKESLKKVQEHDITITAKKYEDVYKSLVGGDS